ncbi:hypothetical protein PFISCL1PPCAC_21333, partial [Pristionchus fissidentatus]
ICFMKLSRRSFPTTIGMLVTRTRPLTASGEKSNSSEGRGCLTAERAAVAAAAAAVAPVADLVLLKPFNALVALATPPFDLAPTLSLSISASAAAAAAA